jgi:hypothetical protein
VKETLKYFADLGRLTQNKQITIQRDFTESAKILN